MIVKKHRFSDRSIQRNKHTVWIKFLGLTILLNFIATISHARQITLQDDFEDQDLTQNVTWNGDLEDFRTFNENGNHLLQLNSDDGGHSTLFTESETSYGSWEFYYRPEANPSNFNRTFFILMSDSDDFNLIGTDSSSQLNGYALRAGSSGSSNYMFKLGIVNNGAFSAIDNLESETIITANTGYQVRVERSPAGDWQIFVGQGYGSTPVADSPLVNENTHTSSNYFGMLVIYSSANTDKFYFDDIIVKGVSEGSGADDPDDSGGSGPDDTDPDDSGGSGPDDTDPDDSGGSGPDDTDPDDSGGTGPDDTDPDDSGGTGPDDTETDDSGGTGPDDTDPDDSGGTGPDDTDPDDSGGPDPDDTGSDDPDDSEDSGDTDSDDSDSEDDPEEEPDDLNVQKIEVTRADQIQITFDQPILATTVQESHFEVDQDIGHPGSMALVDDQNVILNFDSLFPDGEYQLTIQDIESEFGSIIPPETSIPFTVQNPFAAESIMVINSTNIQILFSVIPDESTLLADHFLIHYGSGEIAQPESVIYDPDNEGIAVVLSFQTTLSEGEYHLEMFNLTSEKSWPLKNEGLVAFEIFNPFFLIGAQQSGSKAVDLEFSLDVDIHSVSVEDIRMAGIGQPVSLNMMESNSLKAHFDSDIEAGEYELTVDRISSADGWYIESETTISITFFDSYEPGDLVISEFYYRVPVSWRTETYDRPQYIELYNRSDNRLNLRNMRITGQNISMDRDLLIDPGTYLVISRGRSVFMDRFGDRNFVEADEFPRLNLTTSDRIHLETSEGETIEDLTYVTSEWGGNSVSLERLSFDLDAEHRGNWAESLDALSGSPGMQNTVTIPSGTPVAMAVDISEPQIINVLFSRELLPESVRDHSIFTLDGGTDIESAALDESGLNLILRTTLPLEDGHQYTLGYTGIEDLFGNRVIELEEIEFTFLHPFYVKEVQLTDPWTILINFSMPIQFGSLELYHFSLVNGTTPVQFEITNSTNVELTFSEEFGFGPHRLLIQEIESFDPDITDQWTIEAGTGIPFYRFQEIQPGDILLNEFMIRPPPGVPGFVELYNRSDRFLNLRDFELRRRPGVSSSGGVLSGVDLPIEPNAFLVITDDIKQLIEHFGNGPWVEMNLYPGFTQTAADRIRLIDPSGEEIQKLEYNPAVWGGNEVSLERKSAGAPVNHIFNWGPSIDELKGTPGRVNSVEPDKSGSHPDEVQILNDQSISITFGGSVYLDMANESDFLIDGGIDIETIQVLNLNTIQLNLTTSLNSGHDYTLTIRNIIDIFGNKMETTQTTITYYRVESAEPGDVVINEFMYNEPDDYSRYIELYNRSNKVIDLAGWQQANNTGTKRVLVNETELLHPGAYMVIAPNDDLLHVFPDTPLLNVGTRLSALKNGGDTIIITNESDVVIDSLDYTPEWGGNGVALERLSSEAPSYYVENWTASIAPLLGTPGKLNSVEADQNPPILLSVHQSDNKELILRFDQRPDLNSAINLSNYSFQPHLEIADVIPEKNSIKLRIKSEMVNGQIYGLTVANIRDIFGNVMEEVTASVRYLELSEGSFTDIVINEILYRRAQSGNPQFVELYNRTEKNFDLSGWTLSNNSGSMILPEGLLIPGDSYKVFTDSHQPETESENFLVLSNFRTLNSHADQIVLRNRSGVTIDSLYYRSEWRENPPGVSLERKDPAALSVDPHNWDLSHSETGSTPGEQNSRFEPDESPPGVMFVNYFHPDSIEVVFDKFIRITEYEMEESDNRGYLVFENGSVDRTMSNEGTMPKPRFLINGVEVSVMKVDPLTGNRIVLDGSGVERGENMSLEIENLEDYQGNELRQWDGWIVMPAEPGDLLFNEIMYHPLADNRDGLPDQSEYVEIINTQSYPVSLEGIFLHDEPDENGKIVRLDPVSTRHTSIPPNGYLLIYPESFDSGFMDSRMARFFELNGDEKELTILRIDRNTLNLTISGRAIYVADSTLSAIDQVHYSPDWHNPNLIDTRGIALERISITLESDNPDNWSSSANTLGGTPGRANSIFQHPGARNEKVGITVEPNPFSPDGDGFEDHLFIHYRLEEPDYLIRIRIFDRYGRLVRNLVDGEAAGFEGTRIWDGRMDNGQNNRIGIYIILFNAFDSTNGRNLQFRETAVIARQF